MRGKILIQLTILLFGAWATAQAQECVDNTPPVAVCAETIEVVVDDECVWDAGNVPSDSFDAEGHAFECSVMPSRSRGTSTVRGRLSCTDECDQRSVPSCGTTVVPIDDMGPQINTSAAPYDSLAIIAHGSPTFVIQDDWHSNWNRIRQVCGLEIADNCDPDYAIRRGITAIESNDPDEEITGAPGLFRSAGIWADWAGFGLNLDGHHGAVPRTYEISYTALDESDNATIAECTVRVVEAECTTADDCDDGFWPRCWRPVGQCGGKGVCRSGGECGFFSDLESRWVCGCDGRSHYNACSAFSAKGVNILHMGPCAEEPPCVTRDDCGQFEYCFRPEGQCDDPVGGCRPVPSLGAMGPYRVCGCDGDLYLDEATAASEGQSVLAPATLDIILGNADCEDLR